MLMTRQTEYGVSVPSRRISRLARFGGLGARIAGNMIADGALRVAKGERPSINDLLLTPSNAQRVAEQLSQLRGAAMKLGQLISMDGGDFVPPELAEILARLRSSAYAMPPQQLRRVLNEAWGRDWLKRFQRFDVRPLASASIGQVHRAVTKDGRDLAIKVQYPGVAKSIDSDVDNAAALLAVSGIVPNGVDVSPLLTEAKVQLKQEADYAREGACMERFRALLKDSSEFVVPRLATDFTTDNVLAMDYVAGAHIENLASAPSYKRDLVVTHMMRLLMRELFEFRLMQTDPNFANYLYNEETDQIALLDFGATREISEALSQGYRRLLVAGVAQNWDAAREVATEMGLISADLAGEHERLLRELFMVAMEPIATDGPFDFGATDLAKRLSETGVLLRNDGFVHVPPPAVVFFHRKFGGLYLLAARMRARVDVRSLLAPYF
jgi:predicted unusual protein kinase regulating ubiquinone biosynthesis (AarF/ABC1/UbiB family)